MATDIAELAHADRYPDLTGPELLPARLMRATAAVLPVVAAGISAFSKYRHRVPLGASDDTAALAERLQFTVGEGPCLAAHAGLQAVVAPAEVMARCWPAFHQELTRRTPYRAIVSIPIADYRLGGEVAIDLYYPDHELRLDGKNCRDITAATAAIVALLAAGSGLADPLLPGPVWLNNQPVHARTAVWIAVGLVGVTLQLDSRDALSVLRGYAYSHDTTIDDIARALTNRELPVEALSN